MLDDSGASQDWTTYSYTVPTSGTYKAVFIRSVVVTSQQVAPSKHPEEALCLTLPPPHPFPSPQTNICIVYAVEPSIILVAGPWVPVCRYVGRLALPPPTSTVLDTHTSFFSHFPLKMPPGRSPTLRSPTIAVLITWTSALRFAVMVNSPITNARPKAPSAPARRSASTTNPPRPTRRFGPSTRYVARNVLPRN